jgi:hypothetical protein
MLRLRLVMSVLAAGALLGTRADAQSISTTPTSRIAAPTDVSGAFATLKSNADALRGASPQAHKDFKSLSKVQSALQKRVENAPVSNEYVQSLTRDATALASAKRSSTTAGRIAATRPAERDLNAKYNQITALDATTIGQFADTVMVTIKTTTSKGSEVPGLFVLANYWLDANKTEPSFIFGEPTPCHRHMTPGFYYFWVHAAEKPRVLIEREISGTGIPPSQTIYLPTD